MFLPLQPRKKTERVLLKVWNKKVGKQKTKKKFLQIKKLVLPLQPRKKTEVRFRAIFQKSS
jgi:hypothetical protein